MTNPQVVKLIKWLDHDISKAVSANKVKKKFELMDAEGNQIEWEYGNGVLKRNKQTVIDKLIDFEINYFADTGAVIFRIWPDKVPVIERYMHVNLKN